MGCRESLLVIETQVAYRGPSGAVEAPIVRLIDGQGQATVPRSVAWKSGAKPLAEWLSAGGLRNIKPESLGAIELKFPLRAESGLRLEFGDIGAFAITGQKKTSACASVLKPDEVRAPGTPRRIRPENSKLSFPVHRARYPCAAREGVRTIAAEYPPYLPRQLLVFGRGFLPNARDIELPMGRAPAQAYAYSGRDNVVAVEEAARKAMASDFAAFPMTKHFAFNWGTQKSQSGNEMYSVGIYELRRCPEGA